MSAGILPALMIAGFQPATGFPSVNQFTHFNLKSFAISILCRKNNNLSYSHAKTPKRKVIADPPSVTAAHAVFSLSSPLRIKTGTSGKKYSSRKSEGKNKGLENCFNQMRK
jgi:hypothetical protein